jgi:branched-subunit amino acid permease
MLFLAAMSVILTGVSIPLLAMWASGSFVGQRAISQPWKFAVSLLVGVGLLFLLGDALAQAREGGIDYEEWLRLAWMAGSAMAGQVALLQALNDKREK